MNFFHYNLMNTSSSYQTITRKKRIIDNLKAIIIQLEGLIELIENEKEL